MLFHSGPDGWTTIGTVDYDSPLATGSADELEWHPLEIHWSDGVLRAETTNGRWAEFEVTQEVAVPGSRVGIGSYDCTVHFTRPKLVRSR